MRDETDVMEAIKRTLEVHVGYRNSISAGSIAASLNLKQEDTHGEPRKFIRRVINEMGIPIGGGSKGFYLIASQGELTRCLKTLDNRIKGIQDRKRMVLEAYNDYYRSDIEETETRKPAGSLF